MANGVETFSPPDKAPETEKESAPRPSGKGKWILLIALLIVAVAAYLVWRHYAGRVSSDDAQIDGHITSVAPNVSGTVIEVPVRDNQEVKTGEVLVRIDPRDYQAKVDIAKAELARAQSQLRAAQVVVPLTNETTQSGTTSASAGLANAEAELERARLGFEQASGADLAYAKANVGVKQASNDRAQADLARMKPLVDKAEISKLQYDAYVAAAGVAENELQAAREKLASAEKEAAIRKAALDAAQSRVAQAQSSVEASLANRKQVNVREADAATAAAAVEQAQANLAAAELQLSYCTIAAPVDGEVTRKTVEVGQFVSPGQGLMAIVPLYNTWVTANFKETQLANVHPGERAEIHVDMYGKTIEGTVNSIAGATGSRMSLLPPENATGNFVKVVQRIPVKIVIDRSKDNYRDLILRPGMNVDVTIFTK
jgi:membrane fusion protein (multidrug efflux system)